MFKNLSLLALISILINLFLLLYLVFFSGIFFNLSNSDLKLTDEMESSTQLNQSIKLQYTNSNLKEINSSFQNKYLTNRNLASFFKNDQYLLLEKISSLQFNSSYFKNLLEQIPSFKIFLLLEFRQKIDSKVLQEMRKKGFFRIDQIDRLNSKVAIFYGRYKNIFSLKKYQKWIKDVFILKRFTARSIYTLDFTPEKSKDNLKISFHLPYSKPGKILLERNFQLSGVTELFDKENQQDFLSINLPVYQKKKMKLISKMKYMVDTEALLKNHIKIAGNITVGEYKKKMTGNKLYDLYTSPGEKIIFSPYIDELSKKIKNTDTLSEAWNYIHRQLNKDIIYDSQKRSDFFEGKITYRNIRDMYMSAAQLGERKIGACPSRSSLETAILRRSGIAARTATRLFHIYTEIMLPGEEVRWITTSGLLKEIPLCYSLDEKQSYFVFWFPDHPIRLKWKGDLNPVIGHL